MHTSMQMWTEIRRRVLVEGASKRSICREYGIAFETLQKILANAEPVGVKNSDHSCDLRLRPSWPPVRSA